MSSGLDTEAIAGKSAHLTQAAAQTLTDFLSALMEYLEKNSEYKPHKELAKWIRDGHGVSTFNVRGDCDQELMQRLQKENIPYAVMQSTSGMKCFVIRNTDVNRVKDINTEILTARGNYYQETSCRKLETAIMNSEKIKKKIFYILTD